MGRQWPGRGCRDGQHRDTRQRGNEETPPAAGPGSLSSGPPLRGECQAGDQDQGQVEHERQRPRRRQRSAAPLERQTRRRHNTQHARGGVAEHQRQSGDSQSDRGSVRHVAQNQPRCTGQSRRSRLGQGHSLAPGGHQREQRREELRGGQSHAGHERPQARPQRAALRGALGQVGQHEACEDDPHSGARGFERAGGQQQADGCRQRNGAPAAAAPRESLGCHHREQQRRNGDHGCAVAQVIDEIRSEGEGHTAEVGTDALCAELAEQQVRENSRGRERQQDETLERGERSERQEQERREVEGSRTIRGQQACAGEDGGVPRGQLTARVGLPHRHPQRVVQEGAVARRQQAALAPGGRIGHDGEQPQQSDSRETQPAFAPAALPRLICCVRHFLSSEEATCSEIRPKRKTTIAS